MDREGFASRVTEKVSQHPLIEVIRDEITELPTDAITVAVSYTHLSRWEIGPVYAGSRRGN